MSYNEAALEIGCDHHYVRILVRKERIRIHHREEVRPNVLKVFVYASDVYDYIEAHKVRRTIKVRVTPDEYAMIKDSTAIIKE